MQLDQEQNPEDEIVMKDSYVGAKMPGDNGTDQTNIGIVATRIEGTANYLLNPGAVVVSESGIKMDVLRGYLV